MNKDNPRHAADDEPRVIRLVVYLVAIAYLAGVLLVVAFLVVLIWLVVSLAIAIGG